MAVKSANPGLQAAAQGRSLDINPLAYLEKIQGFDGRKEDLSTFSTNVDDIIPTLTLYNEQAQRMCINIVKSKLTGKARRAMEIHPHINKWKDIKDMLETNFGGFQTSDQRIHARFLQLHTTQTSPTEPEMPTRGKDKRRRTKYTNGDKSFYYEITCLHEDSIMCAKTHVDGRSNTRTEPVRISTRRKAEVTKESPKA